MSRPGFYPVRDSLLSAIQRAAQELLDAQARCLFCGDEIKQPRPHGYQLVKRPKPRCCPSCAEFHRKLAAALAQE